MKRSFSILKAGIFLFSVACMSGSCSTTPVKTPNKTLVVEIIQMKFQPAELTLQKGDTVVWINKDIVAHDVTEENGNRWASQPLAPGQSWSLVVAQSADYYCSIHVVMKGKLIIQ
jgi:plastocyanin